MDTKALRQKILHLAIHGKLVPQDPNDEPAAVLLQRIRGEKERLIKEGKIKKGKETAKASDTAHYENVPFEVPESWEWTTLGEICLIKGGKRIPKGMSFSNEKTEHIYLRVTNMKQNTIVLDDLKYISNDVYSLIKNYTISSSDLYLTIAGTIGSVGIIPREVDGMNLTENAAKLTNITCDKNYLLYALQSTVTQEHFTSKFHQVAQPKLSIETASSANVPLPPLAEQRRIVAEIERWFSLIDIIENGKESLKSAVKQAKAKILDLAIHGKLVPQDPADEPASVLLQRIREEKERLIKDGKIKKGKKAAKASDTAHYENVPFEVPKTWVWCKLGTVSEIARGGSPRPIKNFLTTDVNGVNWIKISDTDKNCKYINSVKEKIRLEGVSKSRMVHKGDFLLTNSMSFGRPYILNVDGCIHDGWLVISPIGKAYITDFLYYLLSSSFAYGQFANVASGGVVTNLNSDKVADSVFPLPPLPEQRRIVAKIEELFARLDSIEANLR